MNNVSSFTPFTGTTLPLLDSIHVLGVTLNSELSMNKNVGEMVASCCTYSCPPSYSSWSYFGCCHYTCMCNCPDKVGLLKLASVCYILTKYHQFAASAK